MNNLMRDMQNFKEYQEQKKLNKINNTNYNFPNGLKTDEKTTNNTITENVSVSSLKSDKYGVKVQLLEDGEFFLN